MKVAVFYEGKTTLYINETHRYRLNIGTIDFLPDTVVCERESMCCEKMFSSEALKIALSSLNICYDHCSHLLREGRNDIVCHAAAFPGLSQATFI